MSPQPKPAIVLLSGGVDSTTTLAIAKQQGFRLNALTFHYGQRHAIEIEAARRVAQAFGVERHVVVPMELRLFGGSALTDELAVPKSRTLEEIAHGIPVTYVPARNTIFLAYALAFAELAEGEDLFIRATLQHALTKIGIIDAQEIAAGTIKRSPPTEILMIIFMQLAARMQSNFVQHPSEIHHAFCHFFRAPRISRHSPNKCRPWPQCNIGPTAWRTSRKRSRHPDPLNKPKTANCYNGC